MNGMIWIAIVASSCGCIEVAELDGYRLERAHPSDAPVEPSEPPELVETDAVPIVDVAVSSDAETVAVVDTASSSSFDAASTACFVPGEICRKSVHDYPTKSCCAGACLIDGLVFFCSK